MNHDYLNKVNVDDVIGAKEKLPDGIYTGDIDGLDISEKDNVEKFTIKLCITSDKGKGRFQWANYIIPKEGDQYFELRTNELIKVMKIIHPQQKELGKWIDNKDYQELIDQSVDFQLKTSKSGYQNVTILKLNKFESTDKGVSYDPFA